MAVKRLYSCLCFSYHHILIARSRCFSSHFPGYDQQVFYQRKWSLSVVTLFPLPSPVQLFAASNYTWRWYWNVTYQKFTDDWLVLSVKFLSWRWRQCVPWNIGTHIPVVPWTLAVYVSYTFSWLAFNHGHQALCLQVQFQLVCCPFSDTSVTWNWVLAGSGSLFSYTSSCL